MTDFDDSDLSEAFKDLTAPRSTANYAHRAPVVELRSGGTHWPQALAGVVAVLVAVGGAGTFLALRNARQNGVATTSPGNPPARYGAAMAYDSAAGVTVMFGGTGTSGTALRDTWVWDGSTWSPPAHSGGPGPMFNVHMSDDPADGGVLLLGMPDVAIANGSGGGISGCVIGSTGSGSANGSSVSGGPPSTATGAPGIATGAPPTLTAPTASLPRSTSAPCPAAVPTPYPSLQTWVFNTQGWHRVSSGAGAVVPYANAELAFDAASGDVLAVASTYYPCGGPLYGGTSKQPLFPCEAGASGTRGSASAVGGTAAVAPRACTVNGCGGSAIACPLVGASNADYALPCGGASVSTWVWSGGRWSARPKAGPAAVVGPIALVGTGTGHASLIAVVGCPYGLGTKCAAVSTTGLWTWNGSTWSAEKNGGFAMAPELGGASLVGLSNVDVEITSTGQTWTWSGGSWNRDASGVAPTPRNEEAIAAGPGNTVVLFGGVAAPSKGFVTNPGPALGSDTWTWQAGVGWRHVAGETPPPPTPCPTAGATGKGCIEILPAQVPPGSATAPQPSAATSSSPATP